MADVFTMTEEDILALGYDDNGVKTPIQQTQMNWIWIIQASNLHLYYVHGTQINWMDQQIINEDIWHTYRSMCYNPKLKSSIKATSAINLHSNTQVNSASSSR